MKSCLLRLQVLRRDAEKFAGCFVEPLPLLGLRWKADRTHGDPTSASHALLATMHTDHLARSLPAHRRGTLRGMDAA
jgi:hypothetical protein